MNVDVIMNMQIFDLRDSTGMSNDCHTLGVEIGKFKWVIFLKDGKRRELIFYGLAIGNGGIVFRSKSVLVGWRFLMFLWGRHWDDWIIYFSHTQ
jgi:hypothetical protein